jgi:hypothetical protein
MAKRIDPAKAKAKRDKTLAAVLGAVLLVAGVVAVPMSLKQWKKLNGSAVETTSTPATTTTPAPVPLAPATPSGDGGFADTVAAPVSTTELRAFDLFESKDPFKPQVDVSAAGVPSGTVQAPTPPGPVMLPSSPGIQPPAASAPAPAPAPAPTGAVISVNGAPAELLGVGVDFPLPPAEALFHVVSLARGKVKISIVGGTYSDGAPTVTLRVGKPLTLENTADGTRYELKVLWVGSGAPPPGLVPAAPAATPAATPSTPTSTP